MMTKHQESKKEHTSGLSIRSKLFFAFLFILLIPSVTIGVSSYVNAKNKVQEKIQISAKQNVDIIDRYLTSYISPKMNDTVIYAGRFNKNSFTGSEATKTDNTLQQYIEFHQDIVSAYVASEKGALLIYPHAQLPAGFDPRTRPWYTAAKAKNGQTIISEPYVDQVTGNIMITIARQLQDGSGVVGFDINLSNVKNTTVGIKIGNSGYPFILSTDGNYLVHPTEKIGSKAKGSWVQPLLKEKSGRISFQQNGQNREMDFTTNKLTGLKIAGEMSLNEVNQDTDPILYNMIIIVALFVLIGMFISYMIVRSIMNPLKQLVLATEKVSEGDLTQTFVVKNKDEISSLGESFNKMVATLKKLIQDIGQKAELLAASSEQLMASSEQNNSATEQIANAIQDVAAGSERQTSMVKESDGVIREMSAEIGKTMVHSKAVADQASETADIVASGNEAIQRSTKQMANIHETVDSLGIVIKGLGERSKEINQIINAISEIAAQTNLLALNAAIEAARAGEHGKGFAVVADEVRKLAEQSANSTENIRQLITSIQQDTSQAVVSMEKGTTEVAKGIELVGNAGESFLTIKQFVEEVSSKLQKVTASIQGTTAGADHIVQLVKGIEEISGKTTGESQDVSAATEEQLASMQEISASASSLAHLAEELQDSIKKFKID